ncbi:hypothetical protein DFH09DRAFT_159565 [Mycena vulgaris]|nr:hypothetical protein DFH09DRAFT_159565 [Mycena vulgaris]
MCDGGKRSAMRPSSGYIGFEHRDQVGVGALDTRAALISAPRHLPSAFGCAVDGTYAVSSLSATTREPRGVRRAKLYPSTFRSLPWSLVARRVYRLRCHWSTPLPPVHPTFRPAAYIPAPTKLERVGVGCLMDGASRGRGAGGGRTKCAMYTTRLTPMIPSGLRSPAIRPVQRHCIPLVGLYLLHAPDLLDRRRRLQRANRARRA